MARGSVQGGAIELSLQRLRSEVAQEPVLGDLGIGDDIQHAESPGIREAQESIAKVHAPVLVGFPGRSPAIGPEHVHAQATAHAQVQERDRGLRS